MVLDHVPDDRMIDRRVSVDQRISQTDSAGQSPDSRCQVWIDSSQCGQSFASDFELPLDGASQHLVADIIVV